MTEKKQQSPAQPSFSTDDPRKAMHSKDAKPDAGKDAKQSKADANIKPKTAGSSGS